MIYDRFVNGERQGSVYRIRRQEIVTSLYFMIYGSEFRVGYEVVLFLRIAKFIFGSDSRLE